MLEKMRCSEKSFKRAFKFLLVSFPKGDVTTKRDDRIRKSVFPHSPDGVELFVGEISAGVSGASGSEGEIKYG